MAINGDDHVRVQFRRNSTEWAYWRILAKSIVRENHDSECEYTRNRQLLVILPNTSVLTDCL